MRHVARVACVGERGENGRSGRRRRRILAAAVAVVELRPFAHIVLVGSMNALVEELLGDGLETLVELAARVQLEQSGKGGVGLGRLAALVPLVVCAARDRLVHARVDRQAQVTFELAIRRLHQLIPWR